MSLFDLSGKTAIVTGGNGGIGLGIAEGLADAGANLVIAARNIQKTKQVVTSFQDRGFRCIGVNCDVSELGQINATVESTLKEYGSVDILVNNAGISGISGTSPAQEVEQIDESIWDQVMDVNLKGVMRFSQSVYPHMKAAGGGKIINIGSMYSIFGSAVVGSYSASKGGVVQLTKSLAVSWAAYNIQVNAILPGWITTEMAAPIIDNETFYDMIIARTPAGRFGVIDELAGAGVFLASGASQFVTGISLPVDGGYSIF
jgi:2-dehydro-3-deoxy-D-gluconate 5-dehydrogenase